MNYLRKKLYCIRALGALCLIGCIVTMHSLPSVYAGPKVLKAVHFNTEPEETGPAGEMEEKAGTEAEAEAGEEAADNRLEDGRSINPIGTFRLTGYCPCYKCSEGYGSMTATGVHASAGRTIAVDPRVIPYGSHVLINGHEYIAEDCGGAIKQNRIDIYFNSHREASNILEYAEVYLIQ